MADQMFGAQQQAQPQLPQVGPQPAPQMVAPAPQGGSAAAMPNVSSSKKNRFFPVGIIAAAVVIVAVAIAIIMLGKLGGVDVPEDGAENAIDKNPEKYSRLDIERNSAAKRVVAAAESYQDGHDGKLPFDGVTKIGEGFVQHYMDSSCVASVDNEKEVRYSSCENVEFLDLSGDPYFIAYNGVADGFDSRNRVDVSGDIKEEKGLYVYTAAHCGGGGMLIEGENDQEMSVLTKLSTGEIVCHDNRQK